MKIYKVTGTLDGWTIISEEVKARTDKEAKSRMKRRYKKIQSIRIIGVKPEILNLRFKLMEYEKRRIKCLPLTS